MAFHMGEKRKERKVHDVKWDMDEILFISFVS